MLAPAMGGVEREESGIEFLEGTSAIRAIHLGAEDAEFVGRGGHHLFASLALVLVLVFALTIEGLGLFGLHRIRLGKGSRNGTGLGGSLADLKRLLGQIEDAIRGTLLDRADQDIDRVFLEALQGMKILHPDHLAVDQERGESMLSSPARDLGVVALAPPDQVGEELDRRLLGHRLEFRSHGGDGALLDRDIAVGAVLGAEFGKEESEELMDLGDGSHGRLAAAARDPLLDGDARGESLDRVDIGLFQLLDELPRIGGHAVEEAPLALGEENIERKGRLAAAAESRHHDHLVARNVDGDVLEVMLPGTPHPDGLRAFMGFSPDCFFETQRGAAGQDFLEVSSGVGVFRGRHLLGSAGNDESSPLITGFRSDVDDPVGGLDDIEVMLDDHEAVSLGDKPFEGFQ